MGAIEYGRYEASGDHSEQEVDVRVISASSVDLPGAVTRGTFRDGLLDRLAFEVITLPPLRARIDDILPLSEHFGRKIAAELGADSFPGFTAEAAEALLKRRWSGNVRELKAVVERNTARAWLADEALTDPIGGGAAGPLEFDPFDSEHRLQDEVPAPVSLEYVSPAGPVEATLPDPQPAQGFQERVLAFERKLIDEAMRASDNHQGKAAERLDLTYHQFRGLMRKHGLKK